MKRVNSYGIACCRKNTETGNYEILLVKKRVSYAFISFIKGSYNLKDEMNIYNLFNNMTLHEKLTILSCNFETIWYACHIDTNFLNDKYLYLSKKFNNFLNKYSKEDIKKIINSTKSIELIWEIPKGYSKKNETYLDAAVREFKEETTIEKNNYKILINENVINYSFIDNNVNYIYHYYVAIMKDNNFEPELKVNEDFSLIEISKIKFISSDEIRFLNKDKSFKKLFNKIISYVKRNY